MLHSKRTSAPGAAQYRSATACSSVAFEKKTSCYASPCVISDMRVFHTFSTNFGTDMKKKTVQYRDRKYFTVDTKSNSFTDGSTFCQGTNRFQDFCSKKIHNFSAE
jgi:hypothetical protein